MRIKPTSEVDYHLVRELKLVALRDAPDSFADSLQDTESKPKEYWVELAKSFCEEHIMLVLEEEGKFVGSVYGLSDSNDENVGRVAGLWVYSPYRGRGFGKALLTQVVSWAYARKFQEVRLWAPAKNSNVLGFYHSDGFELTGVRQQTPNPNLEIVEMKRTLSL